MRFYNQALPLTIGRLPAFLRGHQNSVKIIIEMFTAEFAAGNAVRITHAFVDMSLPYKITQTLLVAFTEITRFRTIPFVKCVS